MDRLKFVAPRYVVWLFFTALFGFLGLYIFLLKDAVFNDFDYDFDQFMESGAMLLFCLSILGTNFSVIIFDHDLIFSNRGILARIWYIIIPILTLLFGGMLLAFLKDDGPNANSAIIGSIQLVILFTVIVFVSGIRCRLYDFAFRSKHRIETIEEEKLTLESKLDRVNVIVKSFKSTSPDLREDIGELLNEVLEAIDDQKKG